MNRSILVFFILLALSGCSFAEEKQQDLLIGQWVYRGIAGQKSPAECPDVLVLQENATYHVLNDCYGLDTKFPFTEKGNWIFNKATNQVSLINRVFESNYHFLAKNLEVTFVIGKLSTRKLTISLGKTDSKYEVYEKIDD